MAFPRSSEPSWLSERRRLAGSSADASKRAGSTVGGCQAEFSGGFFAGATSSATKSNRDPCLLGTKRGQDWDMNLVAASCAYSFAPVGGFGRVFSKCSSDRAHVKCFPGCAGSSTSMSCKLKSTIAIFENSITLPPPVGCLQIKLKAARYVRELPFVGMGRFAKFPPNSNGATPGRMTCRCLKPASVAGSEEIDSLLEDADCAVSITESECRLHSACIASSCVERSRGTACLAFFSCASTA
mmetsp:Transcript_753/g.1369  ORF Transcript_753/g.1369 Transcript_753/m.1369 type:complete len:241 (+) Transcript_753:914-1636(+)